MGLVWALNWIRRSGVSWGFVVNRPQGGLLQGIYRRCGGFIARKAGSYSLLTIIAADCRSPPCGR